MREKFYFDIDVTSKQEFNPWPHSPTFKTLKLIKSNSNVLDIGCAKGYMAKELKKKNCQVVGIEKHRDACEIAKNCCDEVINADIEKLECLPFPEEFFDYIICLDVLEHLVRPDLVLHKLRAYLSYEGGLIVSLPNIARIEHKIKLLLGNFNYSDYGALSKGHLRFFTLKTASELIECSGFKIKKIEPTGLGSIIRVLPTLLAFQFLFVARRV